MPDLASVLPVPRELRWTDEVVPPGWTVREVRSADLPEQGYELRAGADGVVLRHADEAGLRYGRSTLAQLSDGGMPGVVVRDWPDLAVRGFMLDVSRDRVPTRETLERLVGLLELARYNHLQLYIEHAFAHPGQEAVWGAASPITGDDLEWLDGRCAGAGIELVVNQATFGHMERWLRVPAHRHRAECPDGFELLPGVRRPPSVLAPTDDNAAFALSLVREQLRHVRSRRVNVNCDETFELGRGASRDDAQARGRSVVYLEHLQRIAGPLLEAGQVLFWGDILQGHPDALASLPEGLTPVAWLYEAPRPTTELPTVPPALADVLSELGIDLTASGRGFAEHLRTVTAAGRPFWVAPGTSSWNSLVGRIDNARGNLLDAARTGAAMGAEGLLVTDWGDNGHLQPPSVSFGPLVYGGAVAWGAEANADLDLAVVLDRHVFLDDAGVLGAAVERLGGLWGQTGQRAVNGSPLQAALCPHQALFVSGDPDPDLLGGVVDAIDATVSVLDGARSGAADGEVVVAELRWASRLARVGAQRLGQRAGLDVPEASLAAELAELVAEHPRRWLERSRDGGRLDSERHLRRALEGLS